MYRCRKRPWWNDWNWGILVIPMLVILAIVVAAIIIANVFLYTYAAKLEIDMKHQQVEEMNKRISIDNELINKYLDGEQERIQELKRFDAETFANVQKATLEAETKLAYKICPPGTYIYVKKWMLPLRIKSLKGFEAMTYENVVYYVNEIDDYDQIGCRDYWLYWNYFKDRYNERISKIGTPEEEVFNVTQ